MKSKNKNNKTSGSERVPENLVQAVVSLLWHSRWRTVYFIIFAVLAIVFSLWVSLPDSTKEHFLAGKETKEYEGRKHKKTIDELNVTLEPVAQEALTALSVHEFFFGATIVPLAQLSRGLKLAVFVWPINIVEGRIADDDIIGVTLLRTDGSYHVIRLWTYPDREKLEKELGGKDYVVRDRDAGVPLQELGPRFKVAWDSFHNAMKANDQEAIIESGVKMARLFVLESVIYDDGVPELLISAFRFGPCFLSYIEAIQDQNIAKVVFWARDPRNAVESDRFKFQARRINDERNLWALTEPVRD
jgi:hypothetical protein